MASTVRRDKHWESGDVAAGVLALSPRPLGCIEAATQGRQA